MSYHLSLQEAKGNIPLAIHRDEKGKVKDIVFLSDTPDKPEGKKTKVLEKDWTHLLPGTLKKPVKESINKRLNNLIRQESAAVEEDIKPIFDKIKNDQLMSHEIETGRMCVLPSFNECESLYLWGNMKSGKSWQVKNYVQEWQRMHPDWADQVFCISRLEEDPGSLDHIEGLQRIQIGEDFEPIKSEEFPENSVIVFDDIDSVDAISKKAHNSVQTMMKDMLKVGRHHNLWVIVTNHLGSEHNKTKDILNACNVIYCFPQGTSAMTMDYVLTKYGNMSRKDIEHMRSFPSRWFAIRRSYPAAVIHEKGCYLLNTSRSGANSLKTKSSK
jgi:hypothetical protein